MSMRNISEVRAERDRGAVMLWFAASVVVSLGMGALVIDMGALWTERRQLQNGADAAALAVGIECAGGPCVSDPRGVAQQYATANVNDRSASVDSLCVKAVDRAPSCSVPPEVPVAAFGFAEVIAGTSNNSSGVPGDLKFLFAPIFGPSNSGKHVTARSVVAWGPPGKAPIMPFVFSKCSVEPFRQPDGTMRFSTSVSVLTFHDASAELEPAGSGACTWPAGFGFTGSPSSGCESETVILDPVVPGSTRQTGRIQGENNGNSLGQQCAEEIIRRYYNDIPIIVPVMYGRQGQGSQTIWLVDGFVKVTVCGFDLTGNDDLDFDQCAGGGSSCNAPPKNGNEEGQMPKRICGIFEPFVLTDGTIGGSSDYGTRIIQLVG